MNLGPVEAESFCGEFQKLYSALDNCETGIAPALPAFATVQSSLANQKGILIGAQNVHWEESGAHTGEVSVPMLKEIGASFVILGHSERRQFYGETNDTVALRGRAALSGGISAIVCVGESQEEFESNSTESVVAGQLRGSLTGINASSAPEKLVIAYEPVWAIGTGLAATPEQAQLVHSFIRKELVSLIGQDNASQTRIIYGGSTKPGNIEEIASQPDIDGALVGGASLKADSFWKLIETGQRAIKG